MHYSQAAPHIARGLQVLRQRIGAAECILCRLVLFACLDELVARDGLVELRDHRAGPDEIALIHCQPDDLARHIEG